MSIRRRAVAALIAASFMLAPLPASLAGLAPADLPQRLTDQQFWKLSEDLSEADGTFHSDNLASNEFVFSRVVPDLTSRIKPGGVYLGVGPEQNFTYIAALKPKMAFITDVRRANLYLHLMYKALFELSANREQFVSLLFSRPRPAKGLPADVSVEDLFTTFADAPAADEAVFQANLKRILDHLTARHAMPVGSDDLPGITRVYRAFYWYGPSISYSSRTGLSTPNSSYATYRALMTQGDAFGPRYSYLASEENFRVVKDLHARNLIVPVVGNFAGAKALKAVGDYVRGRGQVVTTFYLSNVEDYLRRDPASWRFFCENVATFPLDETSVFIRPMGNGQHTIAVKTRTTESFFATRGVTGASGATGSAPYQFVTIAGSNNFQPMVTGIAEEVKGCAVKGGS